MFTTISGPSDSFVDFSLFLLIATLGFPVMISVIENVISARKLFWCPQLSRFRCTVDAVKQKYVFSYVHTSKIWIDISQGLNWETDLVSVALGCWSFLRKLIYKIYSNILGIDRNICVCDEWQPEVFNMNINEAKKK